MNVIYKNRVDADKVIQIFNERYPLNACELIEQLEEPNDTMVKKVVDESEEESEENTELAFHHKTGLAQSRNDQNRQTVNVVNEKKDEVILQTLKKETKKVNPRQVAIRNVPPELNSISLVDKYFSK